MSTQDQNTLRWISAGLLFVFLVSLGTYALTFQVPPVSAGYSARPLPQEPRVTNGWRGWIDEEGQVVCRGQVVNETRRPFWNVVVMVPCCDSAGRLTGFARARMEYLAPGGSWLFRARSWAFPNAVTIGRPQIIQYH